MFVEHCIENRDIDAVHGAVLISGLLTILKWQQAKSDEILPISVDTNRVTIQTKYFSWQQTAPVQT
eukprot:m.1625083 g.1625083  ORF g.1625083 m.1625083 type:complete len:66 (-) comp25390_c1_seq1:122-319(-)